MSKQWDERFAELLTFIRENGRHPSRHGIPSSHEGSLAWWVKDQRRKMRIYPGADPKRGLLTANQFKKLEEAGIEPREFAPTPTGYDPEDLPEPKLPRPPKLARGRGWQSMLMRLESFMAQHARRPEIVYTASPSEVSLGRWLRRVESVLRVRDTKLTRREKRILRCAAAFDNRGKPGKKRD